MSDAFNHLNQRGEVHMVDVGGKPVTTRRAVAEGWIRMQPETLEAIVNQGHQKGDVFAVARIAGIMASKKTADLVPLCHPMSLSHVNIELIPDQEQSRVHCRAVVETQGITGVEMEALTAVQISLLTIYDMCKAMDRAMVLEQVYLVSKSGGKSGDWQRE